MKRCLLLFFALMLVVHLGHAQYYVAGQDPSWIRWSSLQAGPFQLVYPQGMDSLAFRYARLFQHAAPLSFQGLRTEPSPLQVLLHPYSVTPNGFVLWCPQQMELYTTPDPQGQGMSWERLLVQHESRHVAQLLRTSEGLFLGLHYVLGAHSEGLAAGLIDVLNPGLLEGDAVMAETDYSLAGRGRQADFLMPYRAYFTDSIRFSYDKWHYGSYQHYIPNEYALGYLKLSAARQLNASRLADSTQVVATWFDAFSRHPFRPTKVSREAFGYSSEELWTAAQDYYTQQWTAVSSTNSIDSVAILSHRPKHYVAYRHPVRYNGYLYAQKSSLTQTSHLVRIDPEGRETKLCQLGYINSPLRFSNDCFYWTERTQRGRWEHQNFSELRCYDLRTKRLRTLTRYKKTRFFMPSPSPNGQQVAVAEYLPDGRSRLVLISSETGMYDQAYLLPEGQQLKESVWLSDSCLWLTVLDDQGVSWWRFHTNEDRFLPVEVPPLPSIQSVSLKNGVIYFDSDFQGQNELYALDTDSLTLVRLTHSRIASFDASVQADSLLFASYSVKGYEIASLPTSALHQQSCSFPQNHVLADSMAWTDSYEVRPYSKASHLFRLHSWAPIYFDRDELSSFSLDRYYESVAPGAVLMTQNLLGTLYGQLGYSYHKGFHAAHAKLTYAAWLPVLQTEIHYNESLSTLLQYDPSSRESRFLSGPPSLRGQLRTYLPFSLTAYGKTQGVVPSVTWSFSNDKRQLGHSDDYVNKHVIQCGIRWYAYSNLSVNELYPRKGLVLEAQQMWSPSPDLFYTRLGYYSSTFFLPGFFSTHSIRLGASYQHQAIQLPQTKAYLGSLMRMRGSTIAQLGICPDMYKATCDYAFALPIDWSIPKLLYLKRLECILFAEGLLAQSAYNAAENRRSYASFGTETTFNIHPLRLNLNLNIGGRYTYHSLAGHSFEFLLVLPYL